MNVKVMNAGVAEYCLRRKPPRLCIQPLRTFSLAASRLISRLKDAASVFSTTSI